jgi:microsomal dipeptidase-like Zn-dependent dipeptidase
MRIRRGRAVFVTHAGARAVWDTARMKPDDVLRAVAGTAGVIGGNVYRALQAVWVSP